MLNFRTIDLVPAFRLDDLKIKLNQVNNILQRNAVGILRTYIKNYVANSHE